MTLSKFNVSQLVFQGFSTSRSLYKDRVPLWPLVQEASVAWPFEVLGLICLGGQEPQAGVSYALDV